ncbi:MAG: 50S ribosomal protein L5 [Patescibacteria group bacterium]|nr:50S ribosomal protein L5 [Patescibacteria group bacterium]
MSLKEEYKNQIVPKLMEKFGYKNPLSSPKLVKVVLNIGLSHGLKDKKYEDVVKNTLTRITGQKPVKTKAKKSVSSFKIREGMVVGIKATLRKTRMYDFVEKLVNVSLPRVRDFRGLSPKAIDGQGNLTIGIEEHIVFPEIRPDEVEKLHGLEVTVVTDAKTKKEGLELLTLLGFPFKKK